MGVLVRTGHARRFAPRAVSQASHDRRNGVRIRRTLGFGGHRPARRRRRRTSRRGGLGNDAAGGPRRKRRRRHALLDPALGLRRTRRHGRILQPDRSSARDPLGGRRRRELPNAPPACPSAPAESASGTKWTRVLQIRGGGHLHLLLHRPRRGDERADHGRHGDHDRDDADADRDRLHRHDRERPERPAKRSVPVARAARLRQPRSAR